VLNPPLKLPILSTHTEPLMKNITKPKVTDLIDQRLRSWGFHPYPKNLMEVIIPKVEEKIEGSVTDVLKDTKAVAAIAAKLDSAKGAVSESDMKAARKSKVGKLVVDRLKAINFYPIPDDLFLAVVARVEDKDADVVSEVLKDQRSLASFVAKIDITTPKPSPTPATSAPPAQVAGKK